MRIVQEVASVPQPVPGKNKGVLSDSGFEMVDETHQHKVVVGYKTVDVVAVILGAVGR